MPQLVPPVIDIASLFAEEGSKAARADTIHQITAACETWGFFHVLNHGLPGDLQQELQDQMRLFFHAGVEEM